MDNSGLQPEPIDVIDGALYKALIEVNRLFATSLDLPATEIFDMLANLLVDMLDLALVHIAVLPKDSDWVKVIASAGPAQMYSEGLRITVREDLPEGRWAVGIALRTGKPVRREMADKDYDPWRERAREFGLGGGFAVPFQFPDGQLGAITLYRQDGKSFITHIEGLLSRLGEDLTSFLRRKREHEQVVRLSDFQEAVGTMLHQFLMVADPITAYSEVARILIEKTDAMGVWISVPDGGFLRTVAGKCKDSMPELAKDLWKFQPKIADDGPHLSHSVSARAYRSGKPVVISDGLIPILEGLKHSFSSLKPVNVAGAWPIVTSCGPIAVLVIVSEDPEYFSDEPLLSLLGQLIDGIRIAVQNLEAQASISQITLLYGALLTEGDLLFTVQNEQEFLDLTCAKLIESGLFKAVWIGTASESGSVDVRASVGVSKSQLSLLFDIVHERPASRSAGERAMESGETLYVADYVNDPQHARWAAIAERNGWRSTVSAPIERDGRKWGVLTVISNHVDGFSPGMLELLTRISQIVSHGLNEIDLRQELNNERDRQSWLASHDLLTGLPNRRGLDDHISEAIARSTRHELILAVGMLDLDDFKALNDRYGHEVGDQVLKEFSAMLKGSLRQTDYLARIGGDEFVVVLEDVRRLSDLSKVLRKVETVFNSLLELPNGERVRVGGSLGLAVYPEDESPPAELLRKADQALYRLKGRKGYRSRDWAFYAPGDPDGISIYPHLSEANSQRVPQNLFQTLLNGDGLRVFYQPIVELASGRVVGVEALARLASSKNVIHEPEEFIDDLSPGDQKYLTMEVLAKVLNNLNLLERDGIKLWASVNVSPELLMSDQFIRDLTEVFSKDSIEPSRITLEVLEGGNFISMDDAWKRLIALKELGLDLAIDDIGSAYSSLLRLRDLPIDKMKFDRQFVRTLSSQPDGFHFLNAMLDLSRGLRVDFIVEGAETPEILDALTTLEIPYAQGFAISHPLPFEDLRKWLLAYQPENSIEHPTTSLGLLAFHTRLTYLHHQRLNSKLPSPTVNECPLQDHLERLGYGGSDIDVAHHRYHEMLRHYENGFGQKPNPGLRNFEESREALRQAILRILAQDHSGK
ncbi:MAG: EAL domain-containing protein [Acidimicrobiaceae bacterium]|nr:EAL domain-containing protein [Acidimicrobiaceae bacterium]